MRVVLPATACAVLALAGLTPAAAHTAGRGTAARPAAAATATQVKPSYDEPAIGIVDTGSNESLNVHGCASVNCAVTGSVPDGQLEQIYCQLYANYSGGWVDGLWGETDLWDQLQPVNEGWKLVSDGFMSTGSNGEVAPPCSS